MSEEMNVDESNGKDMSVTDDDRLWAALGWAFWVIAVIALLMEDKKDRPFIRYHAWHSIVAGIVFSIISAATVGCGLPVFIISLWYAYQAYQGETPVIPVLTDFIKGQGWI